MAVQRGTRIGTAARRAAAALACAGALWLGACSSGGGHVQTAGGQGADPQTVDFPIFYVKRYSIPKTQDDLRLMRFAQPSADLYMRTRAAPSGTEVNVTQRITGTGTSTAANYDIKDVSVSADGKTILFAMRGPLAKNMQQDQAPSWRIWQYVIATDTLSPVINPSTDPDPPTVNDVSPQFLPDGRIVFSSTRQRQSEAVLLDEGFPQFTAQDEARTEPAFVLHVMNADGTGIHQVSFNPSDDRDPTVLEDGRLMWTRWDDAPGKDGMHLYTANPDGTNLQLLYGANSHATGPNGTANANATVEFVKAHEMPDGRILALIRPYTGAESATAPLGTDFGGDLVIIDTKNYVENTQPTLAGAGLSGPAQTPATPNDVLTIPGPSPGGRFYAGYPLWDGTGRILVSWSQCRLIDTTVTPNTLDPCTDTALAQPNATAAPPIYSVWMFDPKTNTLQPIMQPTDGIMITDLVAAQPRTLPQVILDTVPVTAPTPPFVNGVATVGVIDIRSVYDFDGVDTSPAGIATLADPAKTTAAQRPARFVRIVKAVPIPDPKFLKLNNAAFGVTDYMRQILGYAPVEPDGSVRIQVPPNVPFQIDVLDANGRRVFPTHAAWLQVQPGEEVKCNGCHTPAAAQNPAPGQTAHSHGRSGVFNPAYEGALSTGTPFPDTVPTFSPNAGETMAETRSRTSCSADTPPCLAMMLDPEVSYADVWTNPAVRAPDASFSYSYKYTAQGTDPPYWTFSTAAPVNRLDCLNNWAATCRIIINYIEHIQPLWEKPRQDVDGAGNVVADHTCTSCHGPKSAAGTAQVPADSLDLTSTASNQQPLQAVSYLELLSARDELDPTTGMPVTQPGPPDANGQPTQVTVQLAAPMVAGSARASTAFFGIFAQGSGDTIHAGILSPSELRLLSEWLDIGAQYFNNPFDPKAPLN
jgi:hypothetical protein